MKKNKSSLFMLFTALGSVFYSHAAILRLNNAATGPFGASLGGSPTHEVYTTLEAAVDAAMPFDTIHMEGSAIDYSMTDLDKPVTIIGAGYYLPLNPETSTSGLSSRLDSFNMDLLEGSSGCRLIGIHLLSGLNIRASNVIIDRCLINSSVFLNKLNNALVENVTFSRCIFLSTSGNINLTGTGNIPVGVRAYNNVFRGGLNLSLSDTFLFPNFENNIIDNLGNNTSIYNFQASVFRNNIIRLGNNSTPNSLDDIVTITNSHNIYPNTQTSSFMVNGESNVPLTASQLQNSVFVGGVDFDDNNYMLNTGSPFASSFTGSDGSEKGIFGGDFKYQLSGVGPIPVIYELNTDGVIPPSGVLNINLSTRIPE